MMSPNFPSQAVLTASHEQRHRDRYLTANRGFNTRPRPFLRIRLNFNARRRLFRVPRTATPGQAK